ncbi:MAG: LysR family transcriptional regulator [Clostridiales bacterium]|nr:LysR family transcriptional regulator [Clostridiales bacterium]
MELRVLQYFWTVVREENISKAAEVLHVTQPTLSRQISQLEEELGVQLFIRGRHLVLTDAGIMLRRRAEEIIELTDKIQYEVKEQGDLTGTISIGSGGLNSLSVIFPEIMEGFRYKYPKVKYDIYTNNADHVKERLDKGLLDFGVLLEPVDLSKYDYIRLKTKERWGVLTRADSELAEKEHITKDDLRDIPIITSNRIEMMKELSSWFDNDFGSLNIFATYNIITNVAMLVSSGKASAVTIEGAVNLFDRGIMVFRPLYPELTMTSVMAWKKFQPFSKAAEKFLDYFKSIHKMDTKV